MQTALERLRASKVYVVGRADKPSAERCRRLSMNYLGTQILAFIQANPEWAIFVIGIAAFGELFAFLSLLFPGTAILIASGTLVSEGILSPLPTVAAGIVGAVLGDSVSFWLGKKFGPFLPGIWPFRKHPERLTRGVSLFKRFGGSSVFIGRFSALYVRLSQWRPACCKCRRYASMRPMFSPPWCGHQRLCFPAIC